VTSGTGVPTHLDLLGHVRDLQTAAAGTDTAKLTHAIRRLRDQLDAHVAAERREQGPTQGAASEAVHRGQQRLLSLVANLEEEACQDSTRPCAVRVAELAALLRRQAAVEQRVSGVVDLRGDALDRSAAAATAAGSEPGGGVAGDVGLSAR